MADALYEQLDASLERKMQEHLDGCKDCQAMQKELIAAHAELQGAGLGDSNFDDIPERASLDDIWSRIDPALDRIDAERYRRLPSRNLIAIAPWAAAIAASVIVFFLVTTGDLTNQEPQPQIVSTNGVNPELMSYLDRAQVMLMQVANTEYQNGSVIPITNTFARNMAFEANLLSTVGGNDVNSVQRKLLKDIEFLLLQIANLDDSNLEQGVALLQQFLEENSILFKIRLLEMRDQDLVI
jgi:hypothetical protein